MGKQKQRKRSRSAYLPLAGAACVLLCGLLVWLAVRPRQIKLPFLTAGNIAVLDLNTGKFVYEKESNTPRPPASLTKLMTLFLVLDDIENGLLDWEDTCTVQPAEALTLGSKYGMRSGEVFTVRQLVAGTVLCSGCDCVQCLVRLTAGDEERFVQRMNEKAQALKLTGTHYVNPTGIDALGHYMTAQNIARLGQALLEAHPELLDFTGHSSLTIGERTFQNMHRMVGRDSRVLGLKTGTTEMGGYNLVTYGEQDGQAYLIVLLDSNNDSTRFSETRTILDVLFEEA